MTWLTESTDLFLHTVDELTDADLDAPSGLPDWTRRHLLAHVASNARALRRLVSWARTGEESTMYASPRQRAEEIDEGARQSAAELRADVHDTARLLAEDFATLPAAAWTAKVVTARGRTVPASDLPWLRTREVAVHAVDLDAGVTFDLLPDGFCAALAAEILPAPRLAAWLTGREHPAGLPELPSWL
jgi:maleylpyruvate isomerase